MSNVALERCTAALGHANVKAFLEVIADGESGRHDESAYRVANGGWVVPGADWRHPWLGIKTTDGGRAWGKYQFIGTTAQEAQEALELDDFRPIHQDLCAVWLIDVRGHALGDVIAGNVLAAAAKLDDIWIAFRAMTPERIKRVFAAYGGTLAAQNDAGAPISPPVAPTPTESPKPAQEAQMGAAALLAAFGQTLAGLIPQIAVLFRPESEVAKRNVALAQLLVDTITQAAGQPTLEQSVAAMQADKAVQVKVQQAVVSKPEILQSLEYSESSGLTPVGGGPQAVQAAQLAATDNRPWWTFLANASFWIALVLAPTIYMVIYYVLYSNSGSSEQLKTVVVTAVLSGIAGSMTGFFFGSAYTATRTNRTATTASGSSSTTTS